MATTPTTREPASVATEGRFSWRQRIAISLVSWAGFLAIRMIAPTLRFRVELEEGAPPGGWIEPAIYVFWHRCVFSAAWFYRRRNVAVMTSRSFDGEYIARIIERLGFQAVRGSSSRGGAQALLGMHTCLQRQQPVAFTIDGPRGPRFVAKPGPVLLARNTGLPIVPFHIAVNRAWVLNSWDAFVIPKPFARALLRVGRTIPVPADSDPAALDRCHAEMQATLERIRDYAEARV